MKTCRLSVLAIGFVLLAGTSLMAQHRGSQDDDAIKSGWLFSLEEGFKQADKNGMPLMVVLRCVP
jgi:hypothetical protein